MYFPEANVLVPIGSVACVSDAPTVKVCDRDDRGGGITGRCEPAQHEKQAV